MRGFGALRMPAAAPGAPLQTGAGAQGSVKSSPTPCSADWMWLSIHFGILITAHGILGDSPPSLMSCPHL